MHAGQSVRPEDQGASHHARGQVIQGISVCLTMMTSHDGARFVAITVCMSISFLRGCRFVSDIVLSQPRMT
ncbi:hypothetical protein C8J27_1244 [Rhodobacter aestuarii]|uniref:Uncharacterized protein n=1 Tax=Rhodobacter aestuarii TaxID=453582 RepID=A0A1N7QJ31_9RHOB|nr:hypothetical protein C8J27_1244 [Rhodobacter aestuarii]SIT22789.1 hypothetical protein SAMN05421580_1264 [Rhodobacter aestuarii]